MYYHIEETLAERAERPADQYVAVLTAAEWASLRDSFDMGIDIDGVPEPETTKAEVNYDSLTGGFFIPDKGAGEKAFSFALDEKGIVFIDDSGAAAQIIESVRRTKKWRLPGLERFIYDFLEQTVKNDRELLERYDGELDALEVEIQNGAEDGVQERISDVRDKLRELRVHYEQLLDFSQELEENENNFFKAENLRYFRLFTSRIERLRDTAMAISEHTLQLRDIYKSQLDVKQNRIMTILTVVTTVFMPLTLIAGWYGMNFKFMPELEWRWSYPVVFIISVLIVVLSLWYFKKKKWL